MRTPGAGGDAGASAEILSEATSSKSNVQYRILDTRMIMDLPPRPFERLPPNNSHSHALEPPPSPFFGQWNDADEPEER